MKLVHRFAYFGCPSWKKGTWVFLLESMRWCYIAEIMPKPLQDEPHLRSKIYVIHVIFQEKNSGTISEQMVMNLENPGHGFFLGQTQLSSP
jgi:hypothetical protein